MATHYYPIIVCIMFSIGTVAQQGKLVSGEHRGHGGQAIHQKISDTIDASIAKATDPFGMSQGRHTSIHGSHSTHRVSGGRGVHTDHEGHAIISGSHGVQGHVNDGSHSKAVQNNHGIQKSDHTEHRQTLQDSTHIHSTSFQHSENNIDSGRHSNHKEVIQEPKISHDHPVPKVQDVHSVHSEHNIPARTTITRTNSHDHHVPKVQDVHSVHSEHNIPARKTITRTNSHTSQGDHETHWVQTEHGGNQGGPGHHGPGSDSKVRHANHSILNSDHADHRQTSIHPGSAHGQATNMEHTGHETVSVGHSGHRTVVQEVTKMHDLSGHKVRDGQSISDISTISSQAGNNIPIHTSIIKQDNTRHLKSDHKIHSGHIMTTLSGSVNPSRQSNVEGSEKMVHSEDKSHVFPSTKVHEAPTILQTISSKHTDHGGHLTPTQNNSEKLPIWVISEEINPSIHAVDANVQPTFESPSHLSSSITQLPSNVDNRRQHSIVRHISLKPQLHDAHGSPANFDMKNSRKPSDRVGSGLNVNHHGDRRMNDKVQNQHASSSTIKNEAKLDNVDVVRTRQSNKQQRIGLSTTQERGVPKAQPQVRNEKIHTAEDLSLKSKKEASSTVKLIGHIDRGEMELHPVHVPPSFSDPDNPNLNIDRSREHANVSNFNSGVSKSTLSSSNINDFLENINTHLNNKGFGFSETRLSNSGVPKSVSQQDTHSISSNTGLSFTSGTVSKWAQGQGDIFTGLKHNSGILDSNNRHRVPSTTSTPTIESTTMFVPQFSAEPTSIRIFAPLMADMMGNRNVYPPIVDPINDPRVPHNHGPMPSAVQNNGISLFDIFAVEF